MEETTTGQEAGWWSGPEVPRKKVLSPIVPNETNRSGIYWISPKERGSEIQSQLNAGRLEQNYCVRVWHVVVKFRKQEVHVSQCNVPERHLKPTYVSV